VCPRLNLIVVLFVLERLLLPVLLGNEYFEIVYRLLSDFLA